MYLCKLSTSMNIELSLSQNDIEDESSSSCSTILENNNKWISNFLSIWKIVDDALVQEYWVDCLIAILKGDILIWYSVLIL